MIGFFVGEHKAEYGTSFWHRINGNSTAVFLNRLAANCQADASSSIVVRRVEPLEHDNIFYKTGAGYQCRCR